MAGTAPTDVTATSQPTNVAEQQQQQYHMVDMDDPETQFKMKLVEAILGRDNVNAYWTAQVEAMNAHAKETGKKTGGILRIKIGCKDDLTARQTAELIVTNYEKYTSNGLEIPPEERAFQMRFLSFVGYNSELAAQDEQLPTMIQQMRHAPPDYQIFMLDIPMGALGLDRLRSAIKLEWK